MTTTLRNELRRDKLWLRLIESYGSRVAESFGAKMPETWYVEIDDLEDREIAFGIKQVRNVTPVHPPTLGQFVQACRAMPVEISKSPTLQEQLCEYVTLKLFTSSKLSEAQARALARPWTFVYREWVDPEKPKHSNRCAECVSVIIEIDEITRMTFSVIDMLGDKELHQRALNRLNGLIRLRQSPARQLDFDAQKLVGQSP